MLPEETEINLRRIGKGDWVDRLQQHTQTVCERFQVEPIRVLPGGVAGLVLLADHRGERVVIKTQPTSLETAVIALQRLAENPYTLQLLDHDLDLNAIMIPYVAGNKPADGSLMIDEIAAMLLSWKDIPTDAFMSLEACVAKRVATTLARIDSLESTKNPPDYFRLLELLPVILELPSVLDTDGRTFMHRDFGPANLLRKKNGDLITIDIGGARGDTTYDIGSISVRADRSHPKKTADYIQRLSTAAGSNAEQALGWGLFHAFVSGVSLYCRENHTEAVLLNETAYLLYDLWK